MIATLEIFTLLTLGIDYAILLGIIGAMLNLIPYIGGRVAVALLMMVALVTKSTAWYAVYVLNNSSNCRKYTMGYIRYVSFHTAPCHC